MMQETVEELGFGRHLNLKSKDFMSQNPRQQGPVTFSKAGRGREGNEKARGTKSWGSLTQGSGPSINRRPPRRWGRGAVSSFPPSYKPTPSIMAATQPPSRVLTRCVLSSGVFSSELISVSVLNTGCLHSLNTLSVRR